MPKIKPLHKNAIRQGSPIVDFFVYILAAAVAFICLYPMYYVLVLSLSAPEHAISMQVYWWPKGFYLGGYQRILNDPLLWLSYRNTVIYAAAQAVLMLITCVTVAYPLTVKRFHGRRFLTVYLLIPMFFSGGIIPSYMLVLELGLYNTPWAVILPGCFSIWYIILCRSYFASIPEAVREAALIDGAGHTRTMVSIYLPMSTPILAVIALYTIIGAWNGWFTSFLYITKSEWQPLQLYLRRILVESTVDLSDTLLTAEERIAQQKNKLVSSQLKYTIIFVSTLPMLIVYPFFQKYFVKGVMLGSLKA